MGRQPIYRGPFKLERFSMKTNFIARPSTVKGDFLNCKGCLFDCMLQQWSDPHHITPIYRLPKDNGKTFIYDLLERRFSYGLITPQGIVLPKGDNSTVLFAGACTKF